MNADSAKLAAGERRTTRARIIAAAEPLFAQLSYDGVSLRNIAQHAGVPVGLVSYHFGGKLGVYQAIFELRTPAMVEQRKAGLALATMEENLERRLEMILKALMLPMLNLRATGNETHFGIIAAREINDPGAAERGIVQKMLDPLAIAFVEQLRIALPDRSEAEIHWLFQSALGVMVYVMVDVGRISRLSAGKADPDDVDSTLRHLLSLLLNGVTRK
ncbi:hypothetical protein UC34_03185 [Pandoraea vervacti]|uniref:HTH tetR-type domain-containing protein n=1 Tax=Pandoraea vervacti TaxID=656178 RepID=A0ABM5T374_9BURK|nr:TetR/AcrR family transcriptional regulator [Pandoraea vervacti]AJP59368.2 hypothetical protein UC34_03185 [Pandoraea vervacti]